MRRFLVRIAIFFVVLLIFDRVFGSSLSYMSKHAKGGYIWRQNFITDSVHADVLILGSSRAIHHYNPQIIKDSLGLTCFNCGQDGNGIIYSFGLWQTIIERYKPSLVICDLYPGCDFYAIDDNRKYLGWLKLSYERPSVRKLFKDVDATEDICMNSYLYRYNSRFHQVIVDYLHPLYQVNKDGFVPMEKKFDFSRAKKVKLTAPVDSQKIGFVKKIIHQMDGVKLVFVISPYYWGFSQGDLAPIREIMQEERVSFIDYSNNPKYFKNPCYFGDPSHLNSIGADEFTRDLVVFLKGVNKE